MAKMTVLSCEICGTIDSVDNRVVTANVCGHRVELCAKERIMLLCSIGVPEPHAVAYVRVFDQQAGRKGTNPTIAQVIAQLDAVQANVEDPVPAAEEPVEELVSVGATEETEVEAEPVKKRR